MTAIARHLMPCPEIGDSTRPTGRASAPPDTRDAGPRLGSPLWTYFAAIITIGLTALVVASVRLGGPELGLLAGEPLFWVLVALVFLGELRPVMVSSSALVGGTPTSTMFTFAVLDALRPLGRRDHAGRRDAGERARPSAGLAPDRVQHRPGHARVPGRRRHASGRSACTPGP